MQDYAREIVSAYIAGNLNNESIAYDPAFLKKVLKEYAEHLLQRIDPDDVHFEEWWQFRGGRHFQKQMGGDELLSMKHSNQLSRKVTIVVSTNVHSIILNCHRVHNLF